ncbi:acyl-CoA dehydrogenase family protein [Streptomyces sp. enrichment culture]|uniref:acyl-CoA dehydrogenase family protein n=1 Tax=Streptomyces sp. enrichment culture TaxID=1795815 RepID=UPI003F56AC76
MHLDHTPERQRLRTELRACFAEPVPDNAYARYTDPAEQKYGGRGMTAMEQFVFFDEAAQAGVPLPLMALNTVGPTIMRYGTDEQKAYFLARVLSGETDFAIGYGEPGAGTDLASLKLLNWQMVTAVQDGTLTPSDASAVKVYGSEARRDAYAWLMEILAAAGPLKEGSAGAVLHGELERGYRSAVIFTFGGGTNEIQREIISRQATLSGNAVDGRAPWRVM